MPDDSRTNRDPAFINKDEVDGLKAAVNPINAANPVADKTYVDQSRDFQESVKSQAYSSPPGPPTLGDRYIVKPTGSGDWTGHSKHIATYRATGWQFLVPTAGTTTLVEDEATFYVYDGANWVKWAATTVHADLSGLEEDDHEQYILASGGRAFADHQSMGNNQLRDVADPDTDDDATNLGYVKGMIGEGAQMLTLFVSAERGDDGNDGSFFRPFATVQAALDWAESEGWLGVQIFADPTVTGETVVIPATFTSASIVGWAKDQYTAPEFDSITMNAIGSLTLTNCRVDQIILPAGITAAILNLNHTKIHDSVVIGAGSGFASVSSFGAILPDQSAWDDLVGAAVSRQGWAVNEETGNVMSWSDGVVNRKEVAPKGYVDDALGESVAANYYWISKVRGTDATGRGSLQRPYQTIAYAISQHESENATFIIDPDDYTSETLAFDSDVLATIVCLEGISFGNGKAYLPTIDLDNCILKLVGVTVTGDITCDTAADFVGIDCWFSGKFDDESLISKYLWGCVIANSADIPASFSGFIRENDYGKWVFKNQIQCPDPNASADVATKNYVDGKTSFANAPDLYYVSTAKGNDTTGDGSINRPYKTIQKVINTVSGTPTIVLEGNFAEATVSFLSGDGAVATGGAIIGNSNVYSNTAKITTLKLPDTGSDTVYLNGLRITLIVEHANTTEVVIVDCFVDDYTLADDFATKHCSGIIMPTGSNLWNSISIYGWGVDQAYNEVVVFGNLHYPLHRDDTLVSRWHLSRLDWQESVLDKDLTAPPGGLAMGKRYVIAAAPTGEWAGHPFEIATVIATGSPNTWEFVQPDKGTVVFVEDENILYIYDSAWDGTNHWTILLPSPHALGGAQHTADTKANLDTKVSDADLLSTLAAEISTFTEKTAPLTNDILLMEDSGALFAKKKVKFSSLPFIVSEHRWVESSNKPVGYGVTLGGQTYSAAGSKYTVGGVYFVGHRKTVSGGDVGDAWLWPNIVVPKNWTSAGWVLLRIHWLPDDATAGNVKFNYGLRRFSVAGGAYNAVTTDIGSVTDAAPGVQYGHIIKDILLSNANFAAGDTICLVLGRDGEDATDTYAAICYVAEIELIFMGYLGAY